MAAPQMASQVASLVERYRSGELSRREFFQMLAFLTGSIMLAHEIMLEEGFAAEWEAYNWPEQAPQLGQAPPTPKESIEAGEKRLPANVSAEWVKYKSGDIEVGGYLARPKTGSSFSAIIVIHENRGLTEFVLDMAQRWAGEGLVALAPDLLSRVGGTASFATMQEAGGGIGKLERPNVVLDLHATLAYLKSRSDVKKDKIGVSGFCWGGGNTFNFATESNEIAFAMPFYGAPPALERAEKISCPIYGVFAETDQRINQNLEPFAAKMKELGKPFNYKIYPGTQHAFMNFTNPGRYNADQAKVAWEDVRAFVKKMTS
jgi:carboxymethylenebutenolidase